VLTLIAVGWFVSSIEPKRPWLAPLSVVILAGCPLFLAQASRGLLDIGLGFFTTMTIAFAELARKRPGWWLGVATAAWLGCLEKMPVPFLVWLLIVVIRAFSREDRSTLRTKWLPVALIAAIIFSAGWPLFQILKYHMSLSGLLYDQVVVWTGPTRLGRRPYLEIPFQMLIKGGASGFVMLISPFIVLFWKNGRFSTAIRELALVSLILIVLAIVTNFRQVRYVIPIIPCLCIVIAFIFYRLFEERAGVCRLAIAGLCVLLCAGFAETKIQINHMEGKQDRGDKINTLLPFLTVPKDVTDEKLIAEKLGTLQQRGTKTLLIESKKPGTDLLWDSFYLFHGNLLVPVKEYTLDEFRAVRPQPPLIGVCVVRDFPGIQELYPTVQIQLSRSKFVCWRVADEGGAQISR
jgi:4-amino-4-deoxy-L-arabinose transferase-like glycosyltransferase